MTLFAGMALGQTWAIHIINTVPTNYIDGSWWSAVASALGPTSSSASDDGDWTFGISVSNVESVDEPFAGGTTQLKWQESTETDATNSETDGSASSTASFNSVSSSASVDVGSLTTFDGPTWYQTGSISGANLVFVLQPNGSWTGTYDYRTYHEVAEANLCHPTSNYHDDGGNATASHTIPSYVNNSILIFVD